MKDRARARDVGGRLAVTVAALGLAAILLAFPYGQSAPARSQDPLTGLTLHEVWEIAFDAAEAWSEDSVLVRLFSVDGPLETDVAGLDGRRPVWIATFRSDTLDRAVQFEVMSGALTEQSIPFDRTFLSALERNDRPALDSPALAQIGVRAGLAPGSGDKGRGLHFTVDTGGLVTIHSPAALSRSVQIDAQTGAVRGSFSETYLGGGILYSPDGGRSWVASNLDDVFVTAVIGDPSIPRRGYAAAATDAGVEVFETADGGATWSQHSRLPVEAGSWPFDIAAASLPGRQGTTILVGTRAGMWESDADQPAWSVVPGLGAGNVFRIAAVETGGGDAVLAAEVNSPSDARLRWSVNGQTWETLDDGAYRVPDRVRRADPVLAINETRQRVERFSRPEDAKPSLVADIDVPTGTTSVATVGSSGVLLAIGGGGTYRSTDQGVSWNLRDSAPAAAVGVSSNGVVLASRFRGEVLRSTDGGQSWDVVISSSTGLLDGVSGIHALGFLSALDAVAIGTGPLWLRVLTRGNLKLPGICVAVRDVTPEDSRRQAGRVGGGAHTTDGESSWVSAPGGHCSSVRRWY